MLQNFHDKLKGVTAFVIVGLIIITFALFGVDSLFLQKNSDESVATVNGEPISEMRIRQMISFRKQQILNRFQDISPELINEELLREPVIDELITRKTVEQAAEKGGLAIAQANIYQLLTEIDSFKTDGVFDPSRYEFVIRQQGYTPVSHRDMLRGELLADQLQSGITASGFATAQMASLLASVAQQTRDFYYLTIPVEPLIDSNTPEEEALAAYYEDNQHLFVSEEQVTVDFIELNLDDLLDEVFVDETSLREQYEAEISQSATTRRVAHILLDNEDVDVQLLNELQEKIAQGDDFSALASEYSVDYGTSESGGDLGFSAPGELPEAVDDALAAMQEGDVSEPVISEAGTHILKLLEVRQQTPATFVERRSDLEIELKRQLAAELFVEQAEQLREASYNADSLNSVADELGLTVSKSPSFGRNGGAEGIAELPLVVQAAFSEDVLENGYVSELLEINDNRVMVVALNQHAPSELTPFEEVRSVVEQGVKVQMATQQASLRAAELRARVEAGESVEQVAKSESLAWQVGIDTGLQGGNIDSEVRRSVFNLPIPEEKPVVSNFAKNNGDQVVVSLSKVVFGDIEDLPATQRDGLLASAAATASNREFMAYQNALRDGADISFKR